MGALVVVFRLIIAEIVWCVGAMAGNTLALKAFMAFFFMYALPIILQSLIAWIFGVVVHETVKVASEHNGQMQNTVMQLTGLGAWFSVQTNCVQSFAVVMGAVATRLIFNFIPFIK